MGQVIAAADIGSNTAHLLIAEVKKSGIVRRVNESDWLSLGEIVSRTGSISDDAEELLFRSLARFQRMAKAVRAQDFYVFATEAVRRASNHEQVLARIQQELGLRVDVITPQREAELSLRGMREDTEFGEHSILVEAGGGSVQVASLHYGRMVEEASLRIGTGALIARTELSQPADDAQAERLNTEVKQALSTLEGFPETATIIASGGVARGMWRALHPDGERTIHARELEFLGWDVQRLTAEQIVARYGVKLRRAETLLPGTAIYKNVLDHFHADSFQVSAFGVREGAVLEIAEGRLRAS